MVRSTAAMPFRYATAIELKENSSFAGYPTGSVYLDGYTVADHLEGAMFIVMADEDGQLVAKVAPQSLPSLQRMSINIQDVEKRATECARSVEDGFIPIDAQGNPMRQAEAWKDEAWGQGADETKLLPVAIEGIESDG